MNTGNEDFYRIKSEFGSDSAISFADFCSLKENEVEELISRVSSISDKGCIRRIWRNSTSSRHPTAQECPVESRPYFGYTLILDNVVDDVSSLYAHVGGVRHYIKDGGDRYDIRGTIQRIPTVRIKLFCICTQAKFRAFYTDFLLVSEQQGLFKINHESYTHVPFYLPLPREFKIIENSSHLVHDGAYSGKEYDNHKMRLESDYQPQGV